MSVRKALHDKLITDFSALKYAASPSTNLFNSVSKFILDIPATTPVCEIVPFNSDVTVEGINFDTRSIGFRALVYHRLEGLSEANSATVIDQANQIEDVVLNYLEEIPNNIGAGVADYSVYRINVLPVDYVYTPSENGFVLAQLFNFSLSVNITVKAL